MGVGGYGNGVFLLVRGVLKSDVVVIWGEVGKLVVSRLKCLKGETNFLLVLDADKLGVNVGIWWEFPGVLYVKVEGVAIYSVLFGVFEDESLSFEGEWFGMNGEALVAEG